MHRHSVDVGTVRLSVLEAGSGRPLVFVHGSVTTSELFRDTLAYYAGRARAIAVDLRGYGESDKTGPFTIERFAADLALLFDRLALDRAVLLGVSMGGFVVQRFALDHGERLAGLVLASTSDGSLAPGVLEGDPAELVRAVGWRRLSEELITGAFPPTTDPAIVRPLLDRIDTWNEEVIAGVVASIRGFATRDELPRLRVPTLILVGTEDRQLPVELSQRMRAAIPDARLAVFEGIGHFIMIEDPAGFRRRLDAFLDEIGF